VPDLWGCYRSKVTSLLSACRVAVDSLLTTWSQTVCVKQAFFLPETEPMSQVFKTSRRVQFRDTDAAGIVHFSVFFTYMEQAEHEFLLSVGLGVISEQDGQKISFPRVHAECDYRSPIRFEELVDIEMVVQQIGSRSVTYQFKFTCEGRDVADGVITVACCDFSTGRPVPVAVPDRFIQALQDYHLKPQG